MYQCTHRHPHAYQYINTHHTQSTTAWSRKHGRSTALGKKSCLERVQGFFQRGSGRSFHVEGLKTEKERQPTVENLVREIWHGEYQKLSGHYWRVCKVEDRHRDKMEEQCA